MPQLAKKDAPWTQAENDLLRANFGVSMPGGLSTAFPYKNLEEITITMNETRRAQQISDRVFTTDNVWDQYYKNIMPLYEDPDLTREEDLIADVASSDDAENTKLGGMDRGRWYQAIHLPKGDQESRFVMTRPYQA